MHLKTNYSTETATAKGKRRRELSHSVSVSEDSVLRGRVGLRHGATVPVARAGLQIPVRAGDGGKNPSPIHPNPYYTY